MFNTKKFKATKDADGKIVYGLDIVGSKKYSGNFQQDAIGEIPLTEDDKYAVFIASGGALFQVSYDPAFPSIPVIPAPGITTMAQSEDTLGVSVLDLHAWKSNNFTSLYVKALNAITLTINIYAGNK